MSGPGILGRVTNQAYPQPGGVKVQVDGVQQAGPQDTISLDGVPGISYSVVDDGGNDRTNVTPTADGMRVLSTILNVSLTATGTTALYTVPGGQTLVVEAAVLRCVQSDTVTGPATAGVGANGAADDIFQSQILTGLNEVGLFYLFPPGGTQVEVGAGGVVSIGVDVAAVATTLVVEVDLIGRLF